MKTCTNCNKSFKERQDYYNRCQDCWAVQMKIVKGHFWITGNAETVTQLEGISGVRVKKL